MNGKTTSIRKWLIGNMRSKITSFLIIVLNVIYIALGWVMYIIFDITSPNDPKFDVNQNYRVIIFSILMIVYVIGEFSILKTIYKKVFNSTRKKFAIYMMINVLVYISPMLIVLIESLF